MNVPKRQLIAPSIEWVRNAFIATVRLNEKAHSRTVIGPQPLISEIVRYDFGPSNLVTTIRQAKSKHAPTAEQILSVLNNSNFRKGSSESIEIHSKHFLEKINASIVSGMPVELVLPSLPFKNQNPLSCGRPLAAVDIGEWFFMAQLRDMIVSVQKVYSPGLIVSVLCDGLVYADIFGSGNVQEGVAYRKACVRIKDALGLDQVVWLPDMSDLVATEPRFDQIQHHIASTLNFLVQFDVVLQGHFRTLRRGMLFNLPFTGQDWETLAQCAAHDETTWPMEVLHQTHGAMIRYASFLLAMSHFDLISAAFPNAIRATVHPKASPQLPLHLVNGHTLVFPYNGLPVISKSKWARRQDIRRAATIMRRFELAALPELSAMRIDDSETDFCYLIP